MRNLLKSFASTSTALGLLTVLVNPPSLKASVTANWDGGGADNLWSSGANWDTNVAPYNPTVDLNATYSTAVDTNLVLARFQTSVRNSPVVDAGGWYLDQLRFNAFITTTYTLSGGKITLRPSNAANVDSRYFFMNQSTLTGTINNDLLVLGGSATNLNDSGSGVYAGNGSTTIFNGGIEFHNAGGIRVSGGTGTAKFNGVISQSGASDGVFGINTGATVELNAANTFTRVISVWNGTLKLGADAAYNAAGSLGISTAEVALGSGASALTAKLLATNAITVARGITLSTNANATYVIGGEGAYTSNFTGMIYNGAVSADAQKLTVTADAGGQVNITSIKRRTNGGLNNTLDTLTKIGAGVVDLTGTSNYAGQTNVNVGTLLVDGELTETSSYGSSGGTVVADGVVVASGASLGGAGVINRGVVNSGAITGSLTFNKDVTINSGATATASAFNGNITDNGTITSGFTVASGKSLSGSGTASGIVTANGNITGSLTFDNDVTINSGATATASAFNGNITNHGTITSGVTLASSKTLSGSGSVSGAVGVNNATINGTGLTLGATTLHGTSTLSGTNTASSVNIADGATTVTGTTSTTSGLTVDGGAMLKLNGSLGGTASVLSTGTLGGTGTITGATTIQGTLAPGNSIGTINTGDLTLGSTSVLDVELGRNGTNPTSDLTNVTGTVTIDSGADLKLTLYTGLSDLVTDDFIFLIGNDDGEAINGVFTKLNGVNTTLNEGSSFNWNSQWWAITYQANAEAGTPSFTGGNDVALMVVPEPSTWAMMIGGIGMLAFGQRLRRRS